ncbi:MAG: pyruvate kinase [Pseudomonadota bacterium]|nr:pyruvate kinase [Pseudomonadota bacterium]
MTRRTKIVATLGPASSDPEVLERMIRAGVDVFRLNFSHGSEADHIGRAELVRSVAARINRTVGILADLQGPKIRVGKFQDGRVTLNTGDTFLLDAECQLGNQERVGLDYPELPNDVKPGDTLLLDDGKIELTVVRVDGLVVNTRVVQGGVLSNNKGINRRGGGLTAPALTAKDYEDIRTAAKMQADFLAVSFPRSGEDIREARTLMRAAGGNAQIMAKIERAEAIEMLEDIIDASDSIMVARGDLAVEVGDAAVPAMQKRMIRAARRKHKAVVTATQMMESMISSPVPTRAEVSDVANAVIDGTDAVMLSAESAVGKFPVETVSAMARVCLEAEKEVLAHAPAQEPGYDRQINQVELAISHAVVFTARHLGVKAIAALTQSGTTARFMSAMDLPVPIYAMSPSAETQRKVTLFKGVYPVAFEHATRDAEEVMAQAEDCLKKEGAVVPGDLIILTIGEPIGKPGGTNTMKIIRVSGNS